MSSLQNSLPAINQSRTGVRELPAVRVSVSTREVGFLLAHIPLALLINSFPAVGVAHAVGVLAVGVAWALSGRKLVRVAYVCAYIAGSEVLWRMSSVGIFWEFSKYAIVLLAVIALIRSRSVRLPWAAASYFILLLPSAAFTFFDNSYWATKDILSSILSGPLALLFSVWMFSNLRITKKQLESIFLAVIGPTLGIASITLFGTLQASDIRFSDESNFATSGGFGPNQVSSELGLGVLMGLLFLLIAKRQSSFKVLIFLITIFLAVQSAMTFSRGGIYNAIAAGLIACIILMKDSRSRMKLLLAVATCVFIGALLVVPALDKFTDGALTARFQDTSLTGRDDLARIDLQIWMENPLMGVGPGGARAIRRILHPESTIAHTEMTRVLAEHGSLGLLALIMLAALIIQNFKRARGSLNKALVASMICWGLLYMSNAAMRLAAPSFVFGLSSVLIIPAARRLLLRKRKARVKKLEVSPV